MNITPNNRRTECSRRGFTLAELMVSTGISVLLGGSVMLLVVQTATEQRNGYACQTVEEQAYKLEANITSCIRSMSANQGMSPIYSTQVITNTAAQCFTAILLFYPTNSTYTVASISYNPTNGVVTYTPNTSSPGTVVTWMSNNISASLTQLYFSESDNLDGSPTGSLINVAFSMNDNGFTQHSTTNNPASIFRSFTVQMRND